MCKQRGRQKRNMTVQTYLVAGIPVEVTKKNIKRLYLKVIPPDGQVIVSSPHTYPDEEIRRLVRDKLPQIKEAREQILAQTRLNRREYVSGEIHYLWGKPYTLEIKEADDYCEFKLADDKIIFTVPASADRDLKERLFIEWYRVQLKRMLPLVTKPLEQKMGISAREYRIKNMKTKWGTCNITKRRIWLNLQLAKQPPECLAYVITHELVHLWEKNHTARFQALVEKFCPQWRKAQARLDQHSGYY